MNNLKSTPKGLTEKRAMKYVKFAKHFKYSNFLALLAKNFAPFAVKKLIELKVLQR